MIVNGAARTLRAPDYPMGFEIVEDDPYTTVAMEPDAVDQGFDMLGFIAPSMVDDDAFRCVVGHGRQSGRLTEHGPRHHPDRTGIAMSVTRWRGSPRRRWSCTATIRSSAQSTTAGTSPSASLEHTSSSCLGQMRSTGSATPRRCSTRSRSSSPACGAASAPNGCSPPSCSPTSSARPSAPRVLGDGRWRDLLDNHDTIVRHELERFGGREVNTAGDGFVATFPSPSAAIACADSLVDAIRVLGIEIRVGIHAGEVEVRGDDVAGMAVHIGARVAALAGPSEVLVSSTVRDIVTGSRHRFADRGEHDLKGVPGQWCLCALERRSRPSSSS